MGCINYGLLELVHVHIATEILHSGWQAYLHYKVLVSDIDR